MSEQRVNLSEAKVLVVDDQPDNLELLCRSLEAAGCNVQVASSGQVALQIAMRATPDLILLDVMMPIMDGYETCRKLKEGEATKDIPVIFLTAHHDVQGIADGFRAGGWRASWPTRARR
jgi:CheY-like chemotaxis protein